MALAGLLVLLVFVDCALTGYELHRTRTNSREVAALSDTVRHLTVLTGSLTSSMRSDFVPEDFSSMAGVED